MFLSIYLFNQQCYVYFSCMTLYMESLESPCQSSFVNFYYNNTLEELNCSMAKIQGHKVIILGACLPAVQIKLISNKVILKGVVTSSNCQENV